MRSPALAALLAVVVLITGCAQPEVPVDHFYRLSPSAPPPVDGAVPFPGTLVVQRFNADSLLSQRPLVFAALAAPEGLRQYRYHLWADTPTRMLQELTIDALRQGRVADVVVTPEFRPRADWEMSGSLRRLEHLRGEAPRVVVAVEFGLVRARDGELVWHGDFDAQEPVAGDSVDDAARAMSRALERVFATLVAELGTRGTRGGGG